MLLVTSAKTHRWTSHLRNSLNVRYQRESLTAAISLPAIISNLMLLTLSLSRRDSRVIAMHEERWKVHALERGEKWLSGHARKHEERLADNYQRLTTNKTNEKLVSQTKQLAFVDRWFNEARWDRVPCAITIVDRVRVMLMRILRGLRTFLSTGGVSQSSRTFHNHTLPHKLHGINSREFLRWLK